MKISSLLMLIGLATAALAQSVKPVFDRPVVITQPGAEFRDEVRPGAMIIGMDRTP